MDGNFRIVQYSENEFGIEIEMEKEVYVGKLFKQYEKEIFWTRVDDKGESIYWLQSAYKTNTLESAREQLEKIKEYPKVIE